MAKKPDPKQVKKDDRTVEKLRNDQPVRGKTAEALKAWRDDVREDER